MAGTERERPDDVGDLYGAAAIPTLRLIATGGRLVPSSCSMTIAPGRTIVGRFSIGGFPLDQTVSERHAVLELALSGKLTVSALRSWNRPLKNGLELGTEPVELRDQDLLRTGSALWVYEEEPADLGTTSAKNPTRTSMPARRFDQALHRAARTRRNVLLWGESGTGKELAARELYTLSGRSGSFVAVNCAALHSGTMEAELFGHVKGAFTDAHSGHPGFFEQAHRGTLFLDEIGDMSLRGQAALLRVIQDKVVRRVKGIVDTAVDVRVIAATNHDLRKRVAEGAFRGDLFYRLTQHEIALPPLRSRRADILPLFFELWERVCDEPGPALTANAAHELLVYPWPGNVREMENRISQFDDLHRTRTRPLTEHAVRAALQLEAPRRSPVERNDLTGPRLVEIVKRAGTISAAAELLGVSRRTIKRRMRGDGAHHADEE